MGREESYKCTVTKAYNVFGHRTMKVSHPVRSAVNKHRIAWLVLQWVTMWESQVLNSFYYFHFFFFLCLFEALSVPSLLSPGDKGKKRGGLAAQRKQ